MAQNRVASGKARATFLHDPRSEDEVVAHLHGGAWPDGRWYCVQAEYRKDGLARLEIEASGFACFQPLVMVEVRHARRAEVVTRPMFPSYLFARFDTGAPGWRAVAHARGVRRIFGPHPERPTPVPDRSMAWMLARGYDRPIVEDPRQAFDPIPAGTAVEVVDGAWSDHRGICLWDDGRRARLAMVLFGRETEVQVERRKVRAVGPAPPAAPE